MSPNRRRPENRGFPTGWRWRGGSICYLVPKGREADWDGKREFRLGRTVAEAYRTWTERLGAMARGDIRTMAELCDRYALEHVTTLAPSTRQSYTLALTRIRAVFEEMRIRDVAQPDARGFYNHLRRERGVATARGTLGVLKHLMTMAAEWGAIPVNPLLGMRFEGAGAAKRLLTRTELGGILSLEPRGRSEAVGLVYVRLALLTGLRRGDILALTCADCLGEEGIRVTPRKTRGTSGVSAIFAWSDELRAAVADALAILPHRIADAPLIPTRTGRSYLEADGRANGFDSLSRRFVDATLREGLVESRWSMKDLRAAVASHAATTADAQRQLLHSSPAVTEKHYRRAPIELQPASLEAYRRRRNGNGDHGESGRESDQKSGE